LSKSPERREAPPGNVPSSANLIIIGMSLFIGGSPIS